MFLFLFLRGVSRENKNPTLDVGNKHLTYIAALLTVLARMASCTRSGSSSSGTAGEDARLDPFGALRWALFGSSPRRRRGLGASRPFTRGPQRLEGRREPLK